MMLACANGMPDVIELLLSAGEALSFPAMACDLCGRDAIDIADGGQCSTPVSCHKWKPPQNRRAGNLFASLASHLGIHPAGTVRLLTPPYFPWSESCCFSSHSSSEFLSVIATMTAVSPAWAVARAR